METVDILPPGYPGLGVDFPADKDVWIGVSNSFGEIVAPSYHRVHIVPPKRDVRLAVKIPVEAEWGPVTGFGVWDAATGGKCLGSDRLGPIARAGDTVVVTLRYSAGSNEPSKPRTLSPLARRIGRMYVAAGTLTLLVLLAERGLDYVHATLGLIPTAGLLGLLIAGASQIITCIMMYEEGSDS